jgi:xylan 1,4-beta-xylosidase
MAINEARQRTICNPIDLPYRLQNLSIGPKRFVCREAADPSVVMFRDRYYMFPSMSGGFWHSADLVEWTFAETPALPTYDYAPDVALVDGALVVCASHPSHNGDFYRTTDPLGGNWERIPGSFKFWDPALFQDNDGRLFIYWGCSAKVPIQGVELDRQTFQPISEPVVLIESSMAMRGWERKGENHRGAPKSLGDALIGLLGGTGPFIEGAWMTKHAGRYYLQYSAPGTELNTYADGYFVGEGPLGPFTYAPQSPFSFKPAGFVTGAGHGSTFQDRHGNWWHAASMRISRNFMFERRLGLFPAGFDADGVLFCNQAFADYPMQMPVGTVDPWTLTPPWMLLSGGRPATASSFATGHAPELAVNEDIRDWWVAADNAEGRWLSIDLGPDVTMHAIQVNLAEHKIRAPKRPRSDTRLTALWRRYIDLADHPTEFLLQSSPDGQDWTTIADSRGQNSNRTHHYVELDRPSDHRFVRLTGFRQPYGSAFAVSGLRIFGLRAGVPPLPASPSAARIGPLDAEISWSPTPDADGYNLRYGTAPDKLYNSWTVRGAARQRLSSLNAGQDYWVAVDTFNGSGVTPGAPIAIPAS